MAPARFPLDNTRRQPPSIQEGRPEMPTEGIDALFLETHNWSKTAEFFRALGYELEFETERNSGLLRNGDSPWIFVAEVPEAQELATRIALKVADADAFDAAPALDVVEPFKQTHWGTAKWSSAIPTAGYGACKHPAKAEPRDDP
jgi:hypothetical protein